MPTFTFAADSLYIKKFKTDKSFQIELGVGEYQKDSLPFYEQGDNEIIVTLQIGRNGTETAGDEVFMPDQATDTVDEEKTPLKKTWGRFIKLQEEWRSKFNKTEDDYREILKEKGLIIKSRGELYAETKLDVLRKICADIEFDLTH